jgi:hypothetical protein
VGVNRAGLTSLDVLRRLDRLVNTGQLRVPLDERFLDAHEEHGIACL